MYLGNVKKGEIELTKENLIYENKYCKFYNDNVVFPSGVSGNYIRFLYNKPFSVAVLAMTTDNKIVLIKTFRHAQRGWGLEIPKGFGEIGEQPIETAKRELLEETGMEYGKIEFVGKYQESPGLIQGGLYCFLATDCKKISNMKLDEEETIEKVIYATSISSLEGYDYKDAITEMLMLKYLK